MLTAGTQSSDVQTKAAELNLMYHPPEVLTPWADAGPMAMLLELEEGSSEHSKRIVKPRSASDPSRSSIEPDQTDSDAEDG